MWCYFRPQTLYANNRLQKKIFRHYNVFYFTKWHVNHVIINICIYYFYTGIKYFLNTFNILISVYWEIDFYLNHFLYEWTFSMSLSLSKKIPDVSSALLLEYIVISFFLFKTINLRFSFLPLRCVYTRLGNHKRRRWRHVGRTTIWRWRVCGRPPC